MITERLYVGSDGGVVSTIDKGKTFNGPYSKHLQNIQCYSVDAGCESWGTVGCGRAMPATVATGVQDNGNLYAVMNPGPGPFTHLDGADGGFNASLSTGWVLHTIGLQATPQPVNASRWDIPTRTFVDVRTPPINVLKPGNTKDPDGLKNGSVVEYLYGSGLNPQGTILRIVPFADWRAFVIQNWDSQGDIIALRGLIWEPARTGIPTTEGTFWGLDQSRNINNQTLVATRDAHVWVSYDVARTWQRASKGLPTRPHCADIRFVKETDGSQHLYLGTYGRSVWIADLLADVEGTLNVPPEPGGIH